MGYNQIKRTNYELQADENHSLDWAVAIVLGAPQLVFLILKLTGVIGWSWWAVLIPLWAFIALNLLILALLRWL